LVAESFRVRACPEIESLIRCTEESFRFVPPAYSDVRLVIRWVCMLRIVRFNERDIEVGLNLASCPDASVLS